MVWTPTCRQLNLQSLHLWTIWSFIVLMLSGPEGHNIQYSHSNLFHPRWWLNYLMTQAETRGSWSHRCQHLVGSYLSIGNSHSCHFYSIWNCSISYLEQKLTCKVLPTLKLHARFVLKPTWNCLWWPNLNICLFLCLLPLFCLRQRLM